MHLFFYNALRSSLKVAYIFKVFGAQNCLMVAKMFDQVTFFCEEYNKFQDSRSIFMISNFKIFPIIFFRQSNFDVLLAQYLLFVYYKATTSLFRIL